MIKRGFVFKFECFENNYFNIICIVDRERMAKSKNHTNHNQNKKAHRNGIKKPVR